MARSPKIRITENDRKEYSRLVKNTKAKVNRTIKNVGRYVADMERDENGNTNLRNLDISSFADVPSLESFQTRDQFNDWKEQQKAFTSRSNPHFNFKKNEHGVAVTDYLLTVGQNREYRAEREARKEQQKREGKGINYKGEIVGSQMERVRMMARPDTIGFASVKFNFKDVKTFGDLGRNLDKLEQRQTPKYYDQRKETMRDNWLKSLQGSFNSLADDIYDSMYSMSPDDWYELYRYKLIDMDFELYDSEGQFVSATSDNLDEIREVIDDYYNGRFNMDMKGF